MVGYANAVPAIVCFELPAREASSFCDFWKLTSCAFISSLIDWSKLVFFFMCLLRINLPNLCPNMIHVDALDFSEWHPEEVISFFWRSVYYRYTLEIFFFFFFFGGGGGWMRGWMIHGESSHLSIFTLLKHLMMLLKYNFFRASFLHLTKDTDSI